ncbi:hypothetical protein [Bacillus pinisoli]|uniref:hypothetical protein n=1 Tax=Bacillus pinisoli TaxID=2901866 RepID=UPI001FF6DFCE|nr:hypothetical protein [Bacillus pinisoli]
MEFIYAYDGMAKPTVGDILITDDDGTRKYYLIIKNEEAFGLVDLSRSESVLVADELPLYQIGNQLFPTSFHEIIIDIIKNRDITIDLNVHD